MDDSVLLFAGTEKLGEISVLAVRFGPREVLLLELRLPSCGCFSLLWGFGFLAFFGFLGSFLLELFVFKVFGVEFLGLVGKLQTNDGLDLSNVLLEGEVLIHESELHLVFLVHELGSVAQTLDENVSLVRSVRSNGIPEHIHDDCEVEMNGGVLSLVEFISDLGRQEDALVSLREEQLFAPLGVLFDVLLDLLVD